MMGQAQIRLPLKLPYSPLPYPLISGKEIPLMKSFSRFTIALLALFAFAIPFLAQEKTGAQTAPDPLVRLLQSKGVITAEEAAMIAQAATPSESQQRLAKLLLAKGVVRQQE